MHVRALRLRPGRAATALLAGVGLLALSVPLLALPAGARRGGWAGHGAGSGRRRRRHRHRQPDHGPGQPDRVGLTGRASSPARRPGSRTAATPSTSTPRTRCASTSAAAPTRPAPATATAPRASAASRPATTTPAIPAVPAFTYLGQTDPFDATPDGPANWQDNVTRGDGTGSVTIQVFTQRESAGLGCDADSPCSIVVVPNYGRGQNNIGDTEDVMDAPWAWDRRTVVPLDFQPVDDACPIGGHVARRGGEPDGGRPAGVVARQHLPAGRQAGRPRLHRDR